MFSYVVSILFAWWLSVSKGSKELIDVPDKCSDNLTIDGINRNTTVEALSEV